MRHYRADPAAGFGLMLVAAALAVGLFFAAVAVWVLVG